MKPHVSPRDFFLHVLSIVTLYLSVIGFLMVVFQVINLTLPDPLTPQYGWSRDQAQSVLRTGVSFLIIFFPAYIWSMWFLEKKVYVAEPAKRGVWVRRWLMYFTMFAAAIMFMVTAVILINTLLSGDLTLRFTLKMLSLLLVAVAVFAFYHLSLHRDGVEQVPKV